MTQPKKVDDQKNDKQAVASQSGSAPANENNSAKAAGEPNIWKWKNTAGIAKMGIEGTIALASLAAAITAILVATQAAAVPALASVANPAGIIVLFVAAAYFTALAYSSCQQMQEMAEVQGKAGEKGLKGDKGEPGKPADFAALFGDAVKSGTIVEEGEEGSKQLFLKLSAADYKTLVAESTAAEQEVTLNVLLKDKSVAIKFTHIAPANDNGGYKVPLTGVGNKTAAAEMKTELGIANSASLKVAVSDKDLNTLKTNVTTKLGEVTVNAAISKATGK